MIDCLGRMGGGEVFVPKIPSMRVDRPRRGARPGRGAAGDRDPPGREAARGAAHRGRVAPLARGGRTASSSSRSTPRGRCARSRAARRCRPASATRATQNDRLARRRRAPRDGGEREGRRLTQTFLPYGRQEISDEDVDAVVEALRGELITQGPHVARFEEAIADYLGARHVVAFANGTAALHGAAFAAGLGPGDEVITTPLSFAGSVELRPLPGRAPALRRHLPVHAGTSTRPRRPRRPESATRAVIAVSFAGLPVDLEPLAPIRDRVVVIEDARSRARRARATARRSAVPAAPT